VVEVVGVVGMVVVVEAVVEAVEVVAVVEVVAAEGVVVAFFFFLRGTRMVAIGGTVLVCGYR